MRLHLLALAMTAAYEPPPPPRTGSRAGGSMKRKAPPGPSAAAVAVGGVVASGVASSAAVAAHAQHGWAAPLAFAAGASAATLPALAVGALGAARRRAVESGAVRRGTSGAVASVLPGDSDERLGAAAAEAGGKLASRPAVRAARGALPWVLPAVDAAVSGAAAANDNNATSARVGAATEGVVARVIDDNIFLAGFAAVVVVAFADFVVYGLDRLLPA